MTPYLIQVPENMSYVNAFRALWEDSQPAPFYEAHPEYLSMQEAMVSTSEKVVQYFQNGHFINYAGGRSIKTDFRMFPTLILYGKNEYAAHKALRSYQQIPPHRRFDKNDSISFQGHIISKL